MKYAIMLLSIVLLSCGTLVSALNSESPTNTTAVLREKLEAVYSKYLRALDKEDGELWLTLLTADRIAELKSAAELNRMKFPKDSLRFLKLNGLVLPPTAKFKFIALTESKRFANLIYVGNMNGYLRQRVDEQRFLIIQFEKENDAWKFGATLDPPTSLVPKLEEKLSSGKLDFLNSKPFTPEKIDLLPGRKTDKPKGTNSVI